MIRVLFQARKDLLSHYGGDTLVIDQLAGRLREYGVEVDVSFALNVRLKRYDLVHIFGLTRVEETYNYYLNAKRQGKPVVVSPFHEELDEWDRQGRYGLLRLTSKLGKNQRELVKTGIRSVLNRRPVKLVWQQAKLSYLKQQNEVIRNADRIITWAVGEAAAVKERYGLGRLPAVVFHGVDHIGYDRPRGGRGITGKRRNIVLCVARIESKKNQLALLESLADSGLTVVLAGSRSKYNPLYVGKVLALVKQHAQFTYVGRVSESEKWRLMRRAKVHVLASWFEIMGLANAEAALGGANLVSTDRGYAKEYFGDDAWYCNPADKKSIGQAVEQAWSAPVEQTLGRRLTDTFSWSAAASQLAKIYRRAYDT